MWSDPVRVCFPAFLLVYVFSEHGSTTCKVYVGRHGALTVGSFYGCSFEPLLELVTMSLHVPTR